MALAALNTRTLELLDAYAADGVDFEMHAGGLVVAAHTKAGLDVYRRLFDELRAAGHEAVLDELDYALRPAVHERRARVPDQPARDEPLINAIDHTTSRPVSNQRKLSSLHSAIIRFDATIAGPASRAQNRICFCSTASKAWRSFVRSVTADESNGLDGRCHRPKVMPEVPQRTTIVTSASVDDPVVVP